MPSYDMTYNGGVGFGGGGVSSWLGGIGSQWANNLANGMRLYTDFYNFQDQNLVRPSYVNAMIGQNNALQQQAQQAYNNAWNANRHFSEKEAASSGVSLNQLYNGQVVPQGGVNVQAHQQANQQTQVQRSIYSVPPPVDPRGVQESYMRYVGQQMTPEQLQRFLKGG